MKRTFSGSRTRNRGDGPIMFRPGTISHTIEPGRCLVPEEAQEHIEYLSQFPAIQVLKWLDSWNRLKAEQNDGKADPASLFLPNRSVDISRSEPRIEEVGKSEQAESKMTRFYLNPLITPKKEATEPENPMWETQPSPEIETILSPKRSKAYRKHLPEIYACLYCPKAFGRKGDWKRHEGTIHEPQKQWHCPDCSRKFTAGNKFRRHHEHDHGCEDCRHDLDLTIVTAAHGISAWGCGFCITVLLTWDDRANHIAFHFESGRKRGDWDLSTVIRSLLLQPGICEAWEFLLLQMHGSESNKWPAFDWSAETSRDLLEKLQSNDRARNDNEVAQLAYNLGSPTASGSEPVAVPVLKPRIEPPTYLPESTMAMVKQSNPLNVNSELFESFQSFAIPDVSTPNDQASPTDIEGSYNFDEYFNNMKNYTTPCAENFDPTAWFMWPNTFNPFVSE